MLKRFLAASLLILLPSLAWGQAAVQQGGSWTSGHIPKYNQTGGTTPLVTDGGGAGGGASGVNPGTLGITSRGTGTPPYIAQGAGPNGENFCMYDAPTTNSTGYHSLCLDPNIGSAGTLSYQAGGGASNQVLNFIINGVTYEFPGDFPTIPVTVANGGTGRTSLTDHYLIVGNGTDAVTLLAPSATLGVALVSQGSAADPAYGTVVVAGGGTGATTANAALNNLLPDQSGQNGKVLQTDGTDASWAAIPGTGTVTSVATGTGLTGGPITAAGTISFATVADGSILANISGGVAAPTANTLTGILDDQIGTAQGSLAMRGAATWGALTPGTTGLPLLSQGPGSDLAFGMLSISNLNIAGQQQGDLAYFNGVAWARLAVGTSGQVLSGGTDPTWQAVNGTQIRMGSDAQGDLLYFNGTDYARLAAGTSGEFLQTQGAGANPQWATPTSGPTQGTAQATTSGTSVTFSSIPSGVKRIIISFNGVSGSSSGNILVQIGDAGGVETSGYVSTAAITQTTPATLNSTAGYAIYGNDAANAFSGQMTLTLVDASSFTWASSHAGSLITTAISSGGGTKSLSAELTSVVISITSGAFDAGSVNIQYE